MTDPKKKRILKDFNLAERDIKRQMINISKRFSTRAKKYII